MWRRRDWNLRMIFRRASVPLFSAIGFLPSYVRLRIASKAVNLSRQDEQREARTSPAGTGLRKIGKLLNLGQKRLAGEMRIQIVQHKLAHRPARFVRGAADMGLEHHIVLAEL